MSDPLRPVPPWRDEPLSWVPFYGVFSGERRDVMLAMHRGFRVMVLFDRVTFHSIVIDTINEDRQLAPRFPSPSSYAITAASANYHFNQLRSR